MHGQLDSQDGARSRLGMYDAFTSQLSDALLDPEQSKPSYLPRVETLSVILDGQT